MGNFVTGLEACANACSPCALSSALLMDGCRGFSWKGGMNPPVESSFSEILGSDRHRHRNLPQSSSASRFTAGAFGFLELEPIAGAAGVTGILKAPLPVTGYSGAYISPLLYRYMATRIVDFNKKHERISIP
jgi:hypothetical protein